MQRLLTPMIFLSLLLAGAIFGFFYAWICSTMWGLDTLEPNTAIAAMNAMNISVRNGVFMPAFFGTPVVLLITGAVAFLASQRKVAILILGAGLVYIIGAFIPTASVNVPMNIALEAYSEMLPTAQAQEIWNAYSPRWQFWNTLRTIAASITLMLVGVALYVLPRRA
ncbi:MAG: anthrone oxygenase family protein [Planktotalea sp.]|uniref:anthrone oxygenase family protein n=1 Tax=Planktotalea sp. TaxID=2029877 RepID=UPI003C7804AF